MSFLYLLSNVFIVVVFFFIHFLTRQISLAEKKRQLLHLLHWLWFNENCIFFPSGKMHNEDMVITKYVRKIDKMPESQVANRNAECMFRNRNISSEIKEHLSLISELSSKKKISFFYCQLFNFFVFSFMFITWIYGMEFFFSFPLLTCILAC